MIAMAEKYMAPLPPAAYPGPDDDVEDVSKEANDGNGETNGSTVELITICTISIIHFQQRQCSFVANICITTSMQYMHVLYTT